MISLKSARLIISSFLFLGVLFGLHSHANALSGSSFDGSRIIDDSIFFNSTSMSPDEIQRFLNAKVPTCDTNHAASGTNTPPFTCLKDFRQDVPAKAIEPGLCNGFAAGNKSSAEIIYQVGVSCGVSPKVLIILLQKEQSLVTDTWPWAIQYRSATGYGCPDTAPCDSDYYGFFNQVYNAARQYKKYARDASSFSYRANRNNYILYNPNSACLGSNIYIQNQATAGLYNYTPYQPNAAALNNLYGTGDGCSAYGNRNFWRMYIEWFGVTTGTPLVQGSGSTVYLVSGSNKYAIPRREVLDNYGMSTTNITAVSDSYIAGLTDGGNLGMLFSVEGDTTVYLADAGNKYGIPSSVACTNWNLNCASGVKQVNFDIANHLAAGGTLQPLMNYNYTVYKDLGGIRYPYISQAAINEDGYGSTGITTIRSALNVTQTMGPAVIESNALVKFGANPTIYLSKSGRYYPIPDGSTYNGWFQGQGAYNDLISSYAGAAPVSSGVLSRLVKTSDNNVYLMDGGQRIAVTTRAAQWPTPQINSALDSYINTRPIKATDAASSSYRTDNGAIYLVQGGKLLPIPSMYDFTGLGLQLSDAINVADIAAVVPAGPLAIGEGTVFKVTDSSAIYLKGPSNTLYNLTSTDQLSQFQLARIDPVLPASQLSQYTAPASLKSFLTLDGGSDVVVVDKNTRVWKFDAAQKSQWGITSPTTTSISSNRPIYQALQPTNQALPQFAQYNGTVYYGSGGVKHPIATGQAYASLGGNASNTFNATKDFIDSAPTGSVL